MPRFRVIYRYDNNVAGMIAAMYIMIYNGI